MEKGAEFRTLGITVYEGDGNVAPVFCCSYCGALVFEKEKHRNWHGVIYFQGPDEEK